MKAIKNFNNKKFFLFIIIVLISIYSCKREHYDYLTENDKQYLLYNLNDTLIFFNNIDTIWAVVSKKEYTITKMRYTATPGIYYEEKGFLLIYIVDSTNNSDKLVSIKLENQLGTVSAYYYFNSNLFNYNDTLHYEKFCSFTSGTKNGLNNEVQVITSKPYYDVIHKLEINKNGFLSINFNQTLSYNIEKYNH